MSKFALVDDAIEVLRQHGLPSEVEHGPHIKIRFINALGSRCCLIVSRTPSCPFTIQKSRSVLRRLLRREPQ